MNTPNPNTQQARLLIAGGFADFIAYLTLNPNPIVVGKGYPDVKIIEIFKEWCASIDFDITEVNVHMWREACKHGFFRRENGNSI
jgi:hypothetical protein